MTVLDTLFKYPMQYENQKNFFNSYLNEIKNTSFDNRTFSGFEGNTLKNMVIGGSADTNPYQRLQTSVRYSGASAISSNALLLTNTTNTSLLYPVDRWFILSENGKDWSFGKSLSNLSEAFSTCFSYRGTTTHDGFTWLGTIISTDIFESAIGEDLTLSFYTRSSNASLEDHEFSVSIWKLSDGANWNLPETGNDPTHTFTTTFSMPSTAGQWSLIEINIPALSEEWDWGEGADPAIAIVFQLGDQPTSDTTANLNQWESGYYRGSSNSDHYITNWAGGSINLGEIVLEIGDSRTDTPRRTSSEELMLCRRYFQYFEGHSAHQSSADYWQPYKPELIMKPTLLTYSTQTDLELVLFPRLDTPFTNPSGSDKPDKLIEPLTKSGVFAYDIPTGVSFYRFAVHADYYFGEES